MNTLRSPQTHPYILVKEVRQYHQMIRVFPRNAVLSPGQEVPLISSLCLLKLGDKVEVQLGK